jgi:hypothetical protein
MDASDAFKSGFLLAGRPVGMVLVAPLSLLNAAGEGVLSIDIGVNDENDVDAILLNGVDGVDKGFWLIASFETFAKSNFAGVTL